MGLVDLWKALVARLVYWLTPKPPVPPPPVIMQAPEPPLKPGICECEHERSTHVGGKGKCCAEYPPDKEWPRGAQCACQLFILNDDDDGDDDPETPSPAELEWLYQR
jgi:hypothetical protein